MRYLVDTDWSIDYRRGVSRVVNRFDGLRREGIGISIVSYAELYDGVFGATDPDRSERALSSRPAPAPSAPR